VGVPKGRGWLGNVEEIFDDLGIEAVKGIDEEDYIIVNGKDISDQKRWFFYRVFIHVADTEELIRSLDVAYDGHFCYFQIYQ